MLHDVISLTSNRRIGTLDTDRYVLRTADRRLRDLWMDMKKHGISVDVRSNGSRPVENVRVVPLVGYLAWAMLRLHREGFTFQLRPSRPSVADDGNGQSPDPLARSTCPSAARS